MDKGKINWIIKKYKLEQMKPFIKWVGGKSQLLKEITELIPDSINTYYEPFIGGGAVLLSTRPQKAVISDLNEELINAYKAVKNNVSFLIDILSTHKSKNDKEYFYKVRKEDREDLYKFCSEYLPFNRAARFIYLNKTCYNGLYRVNKKGQFNTPFGKYKNPKICDTETLKEVSEYLNNNEVTILNCDYSTTLENATSKDFVYFDPPYDVLPDTKSFTAYNKTGFNQDEQIRLRDYCHDLNTKGVRFLLSNSDTPFIRDLYKDYEIITVQAKRSINSDGAKRGKVNEVLVKNY